MYASTYADVLRFAQRRVHPSHAEDVAAEAFAVAWRRIDEAPRRPDEVRAWLFGIARHCLMNAARGQDRREALAVRLARAPSNAAPTSAEDADLVLQRIDLGAAWRRLSDGEQEVLALTVFDGLTSPQAARVLGISSGSYRLRLMRARSALRRQLDVPEASPFAQMETR
jgi:RNA polymerase sigma-70 factor (ECF subfamily)